MLRPSVSKFNYSLESLLEHAAKLQEHATSSWIQQSEWNTFKELLMTLIESISSYASYLAVRNKAMKRHHSSSEPAVNYSDAVNVKYLPKFAHSVSPLLASLDLSLSSASMYHKLFVNDFTPTDRTQRYLFIRELEKGLSSPLFFFTYTHGSSVGNYYFIWKAPEETAVCMEACSSENLRLVEEIRSQIPIYHTRSMRKEFCNMCGRISPKSNPYILQSIYRSLTGDSSAARTTSEEEIDSRVTEALAMEDPDIVIDLRELNSNGSDRFSVFWEKCAQYLSSCTSVHERRHGTVTRSRKVMPR